MSHNIYYENSEEKQVSLPNYMIILEKEGEQYACLSATSIYKVFEIVETENCYCKLFVRNGAKCKSYSYVADISKGQI